MSKSKKRIWSPVSQEYVCRTPYLNIRKDRILFPNGRVGSYMVVERQDFAIVIPRFANGDLLMVRQYRYPLRRYTWEFPMGVVHGVPMKEAAKTELAQETGYRAKKWTFLGKYYVAPGMTKQLAHIYLAENLNSGEPSLEEGEFITTKRFSHATLKRLFESGKLRDGPSLVAWMYFTK